MFEGLSVRLQMLGEGIAELCFDRRGEAINKLDVPTVDELGVATDELRNQPGIRGVLVTSAKSGFIVGADIFEFSGLFARSEFEIADHIGAQNAVFRRFEHLDLPIVLGLGFPRHTGGPLKYADWLGLQRVVERCDTYSSLGPLYTPTEQMRGMGQAAERYFK